MNIYTFMRGFTIRTRMYSAIVVVLTLLLMVGGTGLYGLLHNQRMSDTYQKVSFAEAEEVSQMREAIGRMRRSEKDMLLGLGEAATVNQATQSWQAALKSLRELSDRMLSGKEDRNNPIVRKLVANLDLYQKAVEAHLGELSAGSVSLRTAQASLGAASDLANQIDQQLSDIDRMLVEDSARSQAEQEANVNHTILLFVGAVLLALLIVAPSTIINQQCICEPIDAAQKLAESIAQGHLDNPVRVVGQDEPAQLLRALDSMQQSLKAIVSDVRISADSISIASTEIASGNMDLSARTENTASSLQETSSSMEQLTSTVRHSADSATQANELAQTAASAAHRGSSIVSEVVSNMDEIDGTSKRINDIIGVIDGIAFQTNILALNAAVEAARAGEQGRGFAVVAGEVRSLAQRSATAAREIKHLILTSGEKVASGTRLVHDAGAAMGEIIASVQRVSDIISEITSTSAEQSSGIAQVNRAVSDLDQMTQQNAALVEQSAAAAASLKDQAQRLTQSMAIFKL